RRTGSGPRQAVHRRRLTGGRIGGQGRRHVQAGSADRRGRKGSARKKLVVIRTRRTWRKNRPPSTGGRFFAKITLIWNVRVLSSHACPMNRLPKSQRFPLRPLRTSLPRRN